MAEARPEPRPEPRRQLPLIDSESGFYWTAGAEGQLRIQRCTPCGTWQHPPLPRCRRCGSDAVAPQAVSGRGRVATYTVNHEPWLPGLKVPFLYAMIELEEQKQLYVQCNLLCEVEAARTGMPVAVEFEQIEDVWLPQFRPVEGDAA